MSAMLRPSRLILIRHAESLRNEAKKGSVYFADDEARSRIRGIPDHKIALTPRGIEQAIATGRVLDCQPKPDYLYHSGYMRTEQTAELILDQYPLQVRKQIKVRINPFIRERDPGYAYDMTTKEAETAFPWLSEHWKTFGGYFARPPGGESLADVTDRVYTFLNMLFRDRCGQTVMVVTHGGTLRSFRFLLERWTYEQSLKWNGGVSPLNCGVTTYDYELYSRRLALTSYNKIFYDKVLASPLRR
jgi:broad specificity phosphatase PhoE